MPSKSEPHRNVSRRDLLKAAGAGAALTPLIGGCTTGGKIGVGHDDADHRADTLAGSRLVAGE